jgi:hypothetical protein
MWHVHYKAPSGGAGLSTVSSLAVAIDQACGLLEEGADVGRIESAEGLKVMDANEIREVYATAKSSGG